MLHWRSDGSARCRVLCSGQYGVLEQLGEKQDFEAELSRRGYRHEEFSLHVDTDRRLG